MPESTKFELSGTPPVLCRIPGPSIGTLLQMSVVEDSEGNRSLGRRLHSQTLLQREVAHRAVAVAL